MTMNTDYLAGWNSAAETEKMIRMERLYKESGRTNGIYTGLHQATQTPSTEEQACES